jgi:hypothetical protein
VSATPVPHANSQPYLVGIILYLVAEPSKMSLPYYASINLAWEKHMSSATTFATALLTSFLLIVKLDAGTIEVVKRRKTLAIMREFFIVFEVERRALCLSLSFLRESF